MYQWLRSIVQNDSGALSSDTDMQSTYHESTLAIREDAYQHWRNQVNYMKQCWLEQITIIDETPLGLPWGHSGTILSQFRRAIIDCCFKVVKTKLLIVEECSCLQDEAGKAIVMTLIKQLAHCYIIDQVNAYKNYDTTTSYFHGFSNGI